MKDKSFLMIPGPTPVGESVLHCLAKHPLPHRGEQFSKVLENVQESLKKIFKTKNDVFVFTSSATGAMDAAISNLVNENDGVLSLIIGNFGERFFKIAKNYGADVDALKVDYGKAITPEMLEERLKKDVDKKIKFVTLTHNETSTGVRNDVKSLVKIIRQHGAISIVDAVTSILSTPFEMDNWDVDVVVSGSQKGFMIPPGLAFLVANQRAFECFEKCKHPSFYFNFAAYRKSTRLNSTPFTPNVNLIVALKEALEQIESEGLDNIYKRHFKHSKAIRKAVRAIDGLKLFVEDDEIASTAITSIVPETVSVPEIRSFLKNRFDIVVANGQNDLKDKIFRIGTLGFVCDRDILAAVSALEACMFENNCNFEIGNGLKAAIEVLSEK